jgi:hypothetical protein
MSEDILALVRDHTREDAVSDLDSLSTRLATEFSDDEKRTFLLHFYMYQKYDPTDDFVVDLDDVWDWLGFATKGSAKRHVISFYVENDDYTTTYDEPKNLLNTRVNSNVTLCPVNFATLSNSNVSY